MRHPIRMRIFDRQAVLSELDQYQLENMIWMQLAPSHEKIELVKFEIRRLGPRQINRKHVVKFSAKLKSGSRVETYTTRVSVAAALTAAVDHMKAQVERRLKAESSLAYACLRWGQSRMGSLVPSIERLFRTSSTSCS